MSLNYVQVPSLTTELHEKINVVCNLASSFLHRSSFLQAIRKNKIWDIFQQDVTRYCKLSGLELQENSHQHIMVEMLLNVPL